MNLKPKQSSFKRFLIPMLRFEDEKLLLIDCAGNFDKHYKNKFLDSLSPSQTEVYTEYVIKEPILSCYPNLNFKLLFHAKEIILGSLSNYTFDLQRDFVHFLCSFNGSEHVGRQFLVSHLKKLNWFNTQTCSKNFVYELNTLDGNIKQFSHCERFHSKFFDIDDIDFSRSKYSFGHNRYDHGVNIHTLDKVITKCFVNLVSETDSTGYYPFVTEKFLYSVVTKGLFVAYAQPGWHKHVNEYFGFREYNKLFDYSFDDIQCPLRRLLTLTDMLSKFSKLSKFEWHDLYELEKETLEFNFQHYFSQDYLKHLAKYA